MFFSISQKTALRGGHSKPNRTEGTAYLSGSVALIVIALGLFEGALPILSTLCFDYQSITEHQQYWRLITAHFVHSSFEHLFWDLSVFALCAYYLERRNHKQLLLAIITGVVLISAYLLSPLSDISRYSGLSGVLYSVMCMAAWEWYKQEKGIIGWLPLLVVLTKTLLEISLGKSVFVAEGWTLYAEAHLLGIIAAGISLLICRLETKKRH